MGEISNQQIYDLLSDISRDVAKLETSIEELLVDMRTFNQEMLSQNGLSFEVFQGFPK